MRLTDAKIKSLSIPDKRTIVWDSTPGLGVRISPKGNKSFVYMYRFNGRARMMTIGEYPRVNLADARIKAAEAKKSVDDRKDPGAESVETNKADREAFTVRDLVDEYLNEYAKERKKSWQEDQRILEKELVPIKGRVKAKDIKRRDIVLLLDDIRKRPAPVMANRTLAVIRKMFNFAVSRSILDVSPCVGIQTPAKEISRDRVLSDSEIKQFWERLDIAKMSEAIRVALRLLLVTGQRKAEIAQAEWQDIDLKSGWWVIPAKKTKNGQEHRVPLSGMALELLNQAKKRLSDSPWVIPSHLKDRHVTEPAIDHAVRDNSDIFGFHFTPHDLRRSFATGLAKIEIDPNIIGKLLNHSESGVTKKIYIRHSYDGKKSETMETWASKLESIITGKPAGKIVKLHAGRIGEKVAK